MGVVEVRTEKLRTVESIEALGDAAARIVDPKRIALNPDCGFAPSAGERAMGEIHTGPSFAPTPLEAG